MSEGMTALALRCEQASGADAELDALIYAQMLGNIEWIGNTLRASGVNLGSIDPGKHSRNWTTYYQHIPAYTASLDAAMSLVPESHIHAIFYPEDRIKVQMWDRTRGDYRGFGVDVPEATAATYPLTLTAAALRARALTDPRP